MRLFLTIIRTSLVLMLLCGLLYNLAVTGIAKAVMPKQAEGSLIYNNKKEIIGSALIGQTFTDPRFFHGRVSSIGYNGASSGSPNYAPSNPDLLERTQAFFDEWKKQNPDVPVSELPIDLITNSGSGLDPHISPESAAAQVPRISRLTGIPADQLNHLVKEHTEDRELSLFGEPKVNVLKLNLALNGLLQR